MDFIEKLYELENERYRCLSEIESVEREKQSELEQIEQQKLQIDLKYDGIMKTKQRDLNEKNYKIDAYCMSIASHSCFDAKEIGNAIASLVSTFEGKTYVYQEAEYRITQSAVWGDHIKHIKIIISEEDMQLRYSDGMGYPDSRVGNLAVLLKDRKAILLARQSYDTIGTKIQFYRANPELHTLEQAVRLDDFPYIDNFIDELISNRIKRPLGTQPDSIEKLKTDFISSRAEEIEEKRLQREMQELSEKKQKRLALLRRVLGQNKK